MLSELLAKKPLFCSILMDKVNEYFQDEEHQKEFEDWYEKRYGEHKSGSEL